MYINRFDILSAQSSIYVSFCAPYNEFSSGDKIRIIDGPLCGYEGILIEIKGKKKFGVSISCVNLTAVVDLNTSKMEKCDISNNFREVIIFK